MFPSQLFDLGVWFSALGGAWIGQRCLLPALQGAPQHVTEAGVQALYWHDQDVQRACALLGSLSALCCCCEENSPICVQQEGLGAR